MRHETIKRYRNSGFTLILFDVHRTDSMGKAVLGYRLLDRGKQIFEGEDFHCSPMHAVDSLDAVEALLSFLVLQPGDTNPDYFSSYTKSQIEWRDSQRCDELKMIQMDLEERLERKRGRQ